MNKYIVVILTFFIGLTFVGDAAEKSVPTKESEKAAEMEDFSSKPDSYWREKLDPEEYKILRKKGTERAFTGEYNKFSEDGVFTCGACGHTLFDSKTKFDSGTGWPSFYAPIEKEHVAEEADNKLFMKRTEVLCSRCGSHLGHVFSDGPKPTGLRYCINSKALDFAKRDK